MSIYTLIIALYRATRSVYYRPDGRVSRDGNINIELLLPHIIILGRMSYRGGGPFMVKLTLSPVSFPV